MIDARGIKARPRDIEAMLALRPSLVELHCSVRDLGWVPDRAYGLPLALHVPEYGDDGTLYDPASLDEEKRMLAEQLYAQAGGRAPAWASAFIGRPKIVLHPGGATPGEGDADMGRCEARYAALGRTIAAVKAVAGDHAEVLLENLPRSCWFFGGAWKANIVTGGAELAALGRRYGVGVTLDLCHLFLACNDLKIDYLESVEAALSSGLVRHIHYSDARGTTGEGLQVGEGDLPLREALTFVGKYAPNVVAVPEIWFGHEHGGRGFTTAWARTEKLLAERPVAA